MHSCFTIQEKTTYCLAACCLNMISRTLTASWKFSVSCPRNALAMAYIGTLVAKLISTLNAFELKGRRTLFLSLSLSALPSGLRLPLFLQKWWKKNNTTETIIYENRFQGPVQQPYDSNFYLLDLASSKTISNSSLFWGREPIVNRLFSPSYANSLPFKSEAYVSCTRSIIFLPTPLPSTGRPSS